LIDAGESDFYSEEIENYLNDDLIPIGVENSMFDPEGDILFLKRLLSFENDDSEEEIDVVEEIHVDNSIPNFENELSVNEASDFDNPSFPRPPLEPPDAEFDFELDAGEEISVVMNTTDELECIDPRDEFDDDDYSSFMFLIY
nr:hypothetical protein [Tanacetum cinerariifolium]